MELENLKKLRIILPGLIVFLAYLLFITNTFEEICSYWSNIKEIELGDGIFAFVFIIFGVIYYALNVRSLLFKPYLKKVQDNIYDKLLLLSPISFKEAQKLKSTRKLMTLFYKYIDNDNSLEKKSKIVMLNGIIWSTTTDITLISFATALAFLLKYFFTLNAYNIYVIYTIDIYFDCIFNKSYYCRAAFKTIK